MSYIIGQGSKSVRHCCNSYCDGLLALNLTTETVNSDIFYDFVGGSLIPHMRQFDGSNPRSIPTSSFKGT